MATTEQKIRIAIIVPRLEALGPVIVMQDLVNTLYDNEDFSVKVFYLDSKVDRNVRMSVPVERFNTKKFSFTDFDIVHTNGFRPDLLAFLNRNRIKYHISTIHNFVFEDLEFTYNKFISCLIGNIWLFLWKRADKLVCVSNTLKTHYLKYFDFFIMPSRSEGFGLALIEAIQQKIPVICSDVAVFRELFHEDEVTFFKSEDLPSLVSALSTAEETGKSKTDLAFTRYLNNY